jgi:hypothetical protein
MTLTVAAQTSAQSMHSLMHLTSSTTLRSVGVGVSGAGLGALDERVHGGGQHANVEVEVAWVGVQHLPA